jgi:nucleotide sugar dehydrogenase
VLIDDNISNFLLKEGDDLNTLLTSMSNRFFKNRQSGFALVVDREKKLIGVVADADIRKFLLSNQKLPMNVSEVVNKNFISISNILERQVWPSEIARQMADRGWGTNYPVRYVPVVDAQGIPTGLIDTQDLKKEIEKFRDQVVIVGLGYVGLTVAVALAEVGLRVTGVDSNDEKISQLQSGKSPLYETGIEEIILNRIGKNLVFQTSLPNNPQGLGQSTYYLICLPTPLDIYTKNMDLTYLDNFSKDLVSALKQGDCIVLRSTTPLGTGRRLVREIEEIRQWRVGSDFYFVQAPERTVEGDALREIRELPQIIAGATPACLDRGIKLFGDISKVTVSVSSLEAAEMIKIAGNAYRDFSFAFANQLSEVAREHNVDIDEVISKSNLNYPRSTIPLPSPGVGGPCLTKDPYLFGLIGKKESDSNPILSARIYNESVPKQLVDFLRSKIEKKESGLVLGLAFKGSPPTDDMRNSTNVEIAHELASMFRHFASWDAVVNIANLKNGISEEEIFKEPNYDFIGILNNHDQNASIVKRVLSKTSSKEIVLFDPWRRIDLNGCVINRNVSKILYVTMSMEKEWRFDN